MMNRPTLVWFRQDLRLEDQPAFQAAIDKGGAIIPLFIWSPTEESDWTPGAASKWWLHGSLSSLQEELEELGLKLILRLEPSLKSILEIIKQTKADTICWNQRYEPSIVKRDALIKKELEKQGIEVKIFNGSLLFNPEEIVNKQKKPYKIFTPFWKFCSKLEEISPPIKKPSTALAYAGHLKSVKLEDFDLLPTIKWDNEIKKKWQPGTKAAKKVLKTALEKVIIPYDHARNEPAIHGTSEFSPYLHHGELSPRMIWHAIRQKFSDQVEADIFLRQIGWREFSYYLLHHFPYSTDEGLRSSFNSFPWIANEGFLHAWQKGKTGYPIIDAGMRQMWQIGWMHNRVRMVVGSFLVKDLLISWQTGAKWFWDTLLDADLANNTLGWQWIAGCGTDSAPYFRVFNPITQGEKFDKEGEYVKQWVPELAKLPQKWIHKPWKAPKEVLEKAGVILGETYPLPIINHDEARIKALQAYAKIKKLKIMKPVKTKRRPALIPKRQIRDHL